MGILHQNRQTYFFTLCWRHIATDSLCTKDIRTKDGGIEFVYILLWRTETPQELDLYCKETTVSKQ